MAGTMMSTSPEAGERWSPLKAVMVRRDCTEGCGGEMVGTSNRHRIGGSPWQCENRCNRCGHFALLPKTYPAVEFVTT